MNIRAGLQTTFIAAALGLAPAAAQAAEPAMVIKVGGKNVTWEHGKGTAQPRVQSLLAPGDRISVGAESFIEVEYLADNCVVRVKAGGSVVIAEASPCAAPATTADADAAGAKIVPAASGAVEVGYTKGPVARINRGDGMVEAKVGDTLKVGDEVYAGANSTIILYFVEPQCNYKVGASTVYKVGEVAPCLAAAALPPARSGAAAGASTAGVGAAAVTPGVALGAAAIAVGGAVAVIAATSDNGGGGGTPSTPD